MKRRLLIALLLGFLLPSLLFAQQRRLKGQVVLVGQNDELTPAVGIDVTLKETGDTTRTKAQGLFRIFLPGPFKAGERVTLLVGKPGWQVQYPLDGEARIPGDLKKETVEIRLLPVGSKKFWSDVRIEKLIEDAAVDAKKQVRPEGNAEEIDFSRFIKDWANRYGFSVEAAKAEIDQWATEVEKKQDDLFKLGMAAFARKYFGKAGQLLTEFAENKAKQLDALKQKEAFLTEETVRGFRRAEDARYNNYAFSEALKSYERAFSYLSKERTPRVWARILVEIGN